MTQEEFVWAIRRITGDRPTKEMLAALKKVLRQYFATTFAQVAPVQHATCMADVVQCVRRAELQGMWEQQRSTLADAPTISTFSS